MSTSTSFRLKVLTALSLTTVLLIQAVIYTSCQQDTCIKDAKEASAIIYLHVKSEQQTDATTRVEENLIKDLHILIYDNKDRKSTRLNSSHITPSRMPSSA